jgi:hypothetical protein
MPHPLVPARARTRRFFTVLALAASGLIACAAPAARALAPEPAPVPKRWQLEIEQSPLRLTIVDVPGQGSRVYFYMTFKATNNSANDLLFAPAFELATDDMIVLRSGRDVPAAATSELIERMQNPLLEDQIGVVGTLLRGEENAKEALVAWPMPANFQSEIVVYCAGFSGETATIEVPNPASLMASSSTSSVPLKMDKKVLRKTLMLRYRLPGELNPASGLELKPFETSWIMR